MTASISQGATLIVAVHEALRRDVERLESGVRRGDLTDPVRRAPFLAGWELLRLHLLANQDGEDRNLWPLVRIYLPARVEETEILDEMEAEHRELATLVADIQTALDNSDPGWLAEAAATLRQALDEHVRHEESAALPLADRVLTAADWKQFARDQRHSGSVSGLSELLPYLLDGAGPERAEAVSGTLSRAQRVLLHRVWLPRFAQRPRWGGAAPDPSVSQPE